MQNTDCPETVILKKNNATRHDNVVYDKLSLRTCKLISHRVLERSLYQRRGTILIKKNSREPKPRLYLSRWYFNYTGTTFALFNVLIPSIKYLVFSISSNGKVRRLERLKILDKKGTAVLS